MKSSIAVATFAMLAFGAVAMAQPINPGASSAPSTPAPAATAPASLPAVSRCGAAPAQPQVGSELPAKQADLNKVVEQVNAHAAAVQTHLGCRAAEAKEARATANSYVDQHKAILDSTQAYLAAWKSKIDARQAIENAKSKKKK